MKNCRVMLIFAVILVLSGCTTDKQVTRNATVIFSMGEVTLADQAGKETTLKQGDILKKGALLVTGQGSQCTVQVGNTALVKILESTTIRVERLFEEGIHTLYLEKGKVLSKVNKLKKNKEFNIRTETSLAAVRGTTFSVSYYPGKNVVAVSSGRVEVIPVKKEETRVAEKGKTVVVTEDLYTRDISELEELELEKIDRVEFIRSSSEIRGEKGKRLEDALKNKDEEVEKKIEELKEKLPPKTLAEIKERYNRIDEITLYSGKVYRGVIIKRGATFKILTTSGTVTVPKNKIKRTRIVN